VIDAHLFPRLKPSNHRVTSPVSPDYNCVAWAVGETEHWWQPGEYWPFQVPVNAASVSDLIAALELLGFTRCNDSTFEPNSNKIAVYASGDYFTHVARQLRNGKWTSKLGHEEDIEHDFPEHLAEGVYGQIACYIRKPTSTD
jgi:hypothetical protein